METDPLERPDTLIAAVFAFGRDAMKTALQEVALSLMHRLLHSSQPPQQHTANVLSQIS